MIKFNLDRLQNKAFFNNDGWWVCPHNFSDCVSKDIKNAKVHIHDCTLRDGEQTFGVAFSPIERVRIAERMAEAGISRIEVGMPAASPDIKAGISQIVKEKLDSEIVAFIRTTKVDIDISVECGVKTVILEHSLNPYACESGYGLEKNKLIDRIVSSINYAKKCGLRTIFMGWDVTRGDDLDFLKEVYTSIAVNGEPDSIVVVDTYGVALPRSIKFLFQKLNEWLPNIQLEFHTHNEFGLANAGILEAISEGCRVIHTSVNGLGERTGNAATEEVVAMLELLVGIDTGVSLDSLMDLSFLVENISGRPVPTNKPIVGRGLFDKETGIGIDLQRKMEKMGFNITTQPFLPHVVGQDPIRFVLGKNSGKVTIEYYLDKLGYEASEDQIKEIVDRVKSEGRLQRALLSERQFAQICEKVINK